MIKLFIIVGLFSSLFLYATRENYNAPLQKKLLHFTMIHDNIEREFYVYLPEKEKLQNPAPVLFHLHGGGGLAKKTPNLTFGRFNELAERDGFIVVYPQAVKRNWNDGRKDEKVYAWQQNIDDVGFIVGILGKLKQFYAIDSSRVFTSGMSNGGFMSSRLMCDRADIFRGGAVLTATLSKDYIHACNPSKPMAIMLFNGTDDPLVPYNGGDVKIMNKTRGEIVSTDEYIAFWKEKMNCTESTTEVLLENRYNDGTLVYKTEYSACNAGGKLVLYRIEGGGHTWPGGKQYLGEKLIGKTSNDIVACDVIWEYFKSLD